MTSLEESFHHSSMKYWTKEHPYSYNIWRMKKAYGALDWNENYEKTEKSYQFIANVATKFHNYLLTRRKGKEVSYQRNLYDMIRY